MKKLLFLLLISLTFSCKSRKVATDKAEKFSIEYLVKTLDSEDLEERYPNSQMLQGKDFFEEGTVERPFTILFPDTENQILITWKDTARTKFHQIFYERNGQWKTSSGIQIGTPYQELLKLNKGPIEVYGFGWDYSGAVNWMDGALSDSGIRVFLQPQNEPATKYLGDHKLQLDQEDLDLLDLRVGSILIENPTD